MKKIIIALLMMITAISCYGQWNAMSRENEPTPEFTDFLYLIKDGTLDRNTSKLQFQQNLIDSLGVHQGLMAAQQIEIDNNNDSIVAHNLRINNNLTFINTQGDTITAHNLRINTNVDAIAINTTSFQDTLGMAFVGVTYGDGVTDATVHLQAMADKAKYGTMYIPGGVYNVSSEILIHYGTVVRGLGKINADGSKGTKIKATGDHPVFKVDRVPGESFSYGGTFVNLNIDGMGDVALTEQVGILVDVEAVTLIHQCRIRNNYYNIQLGKDHHVSLIDIINNDLGFSERAGIYGRSIPGKLINAITIERNNISQGSGHGIDLTGSNLTYRRNTIQGNDSIAIKIDPSDQGAEISVLSNIVIEQGYSEFNDGGFLLATTGYWTIPSTYYYAIEGLTIRDNFIFEDGAVILATTGDEAAINFKELPGSAGYAGFESIKIQNPSIGSPNGYHFDGHNSILNERFIIEYKNHETADEFINTSDATRVWGGVANASFITEVFTGLTAIADNDIHPKVRMSATSPVDFTTNPQIPAGFDGQEIVFLGSSDTNDFTFHDGTGFNLGSSTRVLGNGDILKVEYDSSNGWWGESRFSDN